MTRPTRFLVLAAIAVASTSASLPGRAEAQRVVRRPAVRSAIVVSPRYYRPWYFRPAFFYPGYYAPFYRSYYSPYYWGFYGQYPHGPYGWPRATYDNTGSARLQVTPREAQVFVDGYFVGTVDNFDGYLQRLHVPAGEHELTFYMEGYRTIREKVLFRPRGTLKVTYTMQPLGPGETNEPRPTPTEGTRAEHDPRRHAYGRGQQANFGSLSLRVQPDDASVVIDGEEWDRPEGEDRFSIDLPEGMHRLEVRKDGFRTYIRTIQIRRGQTVTLNVSLTTGGSA